jgi:hypothetical protein
LGTSPQTGLTLVLVSGNVFGFGEGGTWSPDRQPDCLGKGMGLWTAMERARLAPRTGLTCGLVAGNVFWVWGGLGYIWQPDRGLD